MPQKCSESDQEQRIALYKSDQSNLFMCYMFIKLLMNVYASQWFIYNCNFYV